MILGLMINAFKSCLFGFAIEDTFMLAATRFLSCKQGRFMFPFLGLTIGGNHRRVEFWKPVIDRLKARLSSWKGIMLSIGGRVTLLKSVLTNLPIHYLSFFKASRKELDGLGIKDIGVFNISLLSKWLLRFVSSDHPLWCGMLEARYGSYRSRVLSHEDFVPKSNQSIWWRDIMYVVDFMVEGSFSRVVTCKFGDESDIPLWNSRWIEGSTLKDLFPAPFAAATNKHGLVAVLVAGMVTTFCGTSIS
ncbi:unnamed protein product [Lathyrus sativus]|nr:unnamed protein product [Lathyrus sativus]